jgi:hypothetical protein
MTGEQPESRSELQQQIDDLRGRVDELHARMEVSKHRADASDARADAAERRADASQARADASQARADASEARADVANHRADASEALSADDRRRIEDLEVRSDIDLALIVELRREGLISQEHAANLKDALRSSRRIGAAIGIVMANRRVTEEQAFLILSRTSQHINRKVRLLADDIVESGDTSGLR